MLEVNIRILKLLSESKNITQREVSNNLDISLGKVNSTIKDLEKNGYLNIEYKGRKRIYTITEKGLCIISQNIKKLKELRVSIHNNELKPIRIAVILGAGKVDKYNKPAAFLEYNKERVIDKMLKILYDCGIKKVITVSGYKNEYYCELQKNDKRIINIVNNKYENTGSMISLAMCNEYIKDDFILIENDLVFEEKAIKNILNNNGKDCVLISNLTDKERQVMVEIRNDKLFKLSKDRRDFNRIDGEFIGITKISKKFYDLMLKEIEINENKLVNYEHIILDISRYYNVGVEFVENLKWHEIT